MDRVDSISVLVSTIYSVLKISFNSLPTTLGSVFFPSLAIERLLRLLLDVEVFSNNISSKYRSDEIVCNSSITRCPPIGWARQNAAPLKFDPKPSDAVFTAVVFELR